jgi:hypothetical protein
MKLGLNAAYMTMAARQDRRVRGVNASLGVPP